ncbi:MAG: FlgD immunoglobulin-like domain containing protein [Candidatus Eisenbacteria bacterium]
MNNWRTAAAALLCILSFAAGPASGMSSTGWVTSTSISLSWTAPGDDWNEGRASRYDLRFATLPISGTDSLAWWNASSTVICTGLPTPGAPGSSDSFVVTGLAPGQTYYFVLRTADEVPNWSFFSNVAFASTLARPDTTSPPEDDTPPVPVGGIAATPSQDGISLSWSPSPDPDVAGYLVYRSCSQSDLEQLTPGLILENSYLDRTVLPGVTYYYTVTAVDFASNESPVAQVVGVTAASVTPVTTRLLSPFPDPCVNQAVLRYEVAQEEEDCALKIFDVTGRLVRVLRQGRMGPGQHSTLWDLREDNGRRVRPGVYLCTLNAGRSTSTKKLAVLQ